MKRILNDHIITFAVTFHIRHGDGDPLTLPRRSQLDAKPRKRFAAQYLDEDGYGEEEWIYSVAAKDLDAFEEVIARCKNVVSYERTRGSGECAAIKTVFGGRGTTH
jgi:hypothetical protein